MQVSFSHALDSKRVQNSIGRLTATTGWRTARGLVADVDRETAVRALMREAEEYCADALVDVSFTVEEVRGPDIDGVPLRRVTATGMAVMFAMAA